MMILTERIPHPVKETFISLAGIGLEVRRCFEFLHHCFFFLSQCLGSPDVDVNQEVAFLITIHGRQAFSFQSHHFS